MSSATVHVMRRALQVCQRGFFLRRSGAAAGVTLRPGSYCDLRHFTDAQTRSKADHSETPPLPPPLAQRSVFMQQLCLCGSPSDVLDLTLRVAPTAAQTSHCLSRMWNSLKKLTEEQRRAELRLMWEHAAWEPLLQRAVGGASHLPEPHLAYSLLALVKLGIGQRTRVVQTYLRVAQERINDFDDKSLSILSTCLENMTEGANVRALKHAIRLLVEDRLPRIDNVLHLQTMMRLMGKDAPLKLKLKLEAKALSLSDQFSLPNAQYMISSMSALGLSSKPLLYTCSRKITEQVSVIPFNRLLSVLVSCRELKFRDEQLLNAVSEHGANMASVWSHRQLILILSTLEASSFCPESLLDSFSDLVQSDPGALTLKDLLCVVRVCSSLNYHSPSFLMCLSSALEQYLNRMTPLQLLNALYHLTTTGHSPPHLLRALLQETTLQQLRDTDIPFVQAQLKVLELCLRLEHPDLLQTFSTSSTLSLTPPPDAPPVFSSKAQFSSALQTLMSSRDDWTVTEAQLLHGYHFIDAVLTRKTRNDDLENSHEETKQSVPFAPDSVAVLCAPASSFCFGSSRPRGPLALKLRHLQILGYVPLLVPEQQLLSQTAVQRVDYLRERIFNSNGPQRDQAPPRS